ANSVDCGGDRAGTPFENFAACAGLGGSLNIISESFDVSTDDDWDDFSPKVAVEFHPSDGILLFASASKGFKSGGFAGSQGVEAAATDPVDPEIAWNYELGFKGDLLDNSLRLNLTAFYTDYEDLQIVRFGPVPGSEFGTFQTTNIGEAEILGAEVEFTWHVTENFRFSGNYAYLDTEVDDLIINTTGGEVDASGSDLRQAPENSVSISLAYSVPTDAGNFDARLDYSNIDEQITDYINQDTVVERAELWDGRIAWNSPNEKWEVALWGKNLLDSDYFSHSYVIGPGVIGVWGAPRTFGVSATWNL
ncbi:MAG: TonB-dependent receptor, partial [Pseudomonadales bacterium]